MRATGIAAPAPVACRGDGSEQQQVASAFVSAAIRLGPVLLPDDGATLSPYLGRHRRSITVCLGTLCPAARS